MTILKVPNLVKEKLFLGIILPLIKTELSIDQDRVHQDIAFFLILFHVFNEEYKNGCEVEIEKYFLMITVLHPESDYEKMIFLSHSHTNNIFFLFLTIKYPIFRF